jgi:hypothetical protein
MVLPHMMASVLLSAILITRANPATAEGSLHTALAPAGLEDTTAMASSLCTLGFSSLLEVQLLHADEAQEMWATLREAGRNI